MMIFLFIKIIYGIRKTLVKKSLERRKRFLEIKSIETEQG